MGAVLKEIESSYTNASITLREKKIAISPKKIMLKIFLLIVILVVACSILSVFETDIQSKNSNVLQKIDEIEQQKNEIDRLLVIAKRDAVKKAKKAGYVTNKKQLLVGK